ncbi:unnamed protein product [Paramecium sonneborni]|uniref:Vesicle transport v-SNARE N-terminal domain-containing protein n=1 Tax=Paramecium sonneborni TaxID=65129 RepID=A0A8S1PDJ5_9CILI|nr:unnamed protein product [Paramecium sonneborni]
MSEVFSSYEVEFEKYQQQICSLIRQTQINQSNETFNEISQIFSDLQNCLQQMDIESTSVPQADRQELKNKVKTYKSETEALKKQFKIIQDEIQSQKVKDSLFGEQENQQIQFINTQDKLVKQTIQLEEAKKVCFEIEQISTNIQVQLNGQTEILDRNINKMPEIQYDLGESNSTLSRIQQKMRERKIIFLIVLAIFLTGISIVLVYKYA